MEFLDSRVTVKGFVGGQGSGKSKVGAYDLLSRVRPGRLYVVTAPTYKVLRDATCRSFDEVARYCGVMLKPVGGEAFSALVRPFSGGGSAEVLFRSTEDPEMLRGPNLSGGWMDEASLSPYPAYQIMIARLREGGELGWLSLTFTPKGRSHWTYTEVFGKEPPRTDVHLTRAATRDNPFLSEDFVRTVESNYAGLLAEQELGGEFVTVEGAEWPPEYFPPSIWFDDWPTELTIRTGGLDPSKGKDAKHGDYSAIVTLARCNQGKLWCEADLGRRTAEVIVDTLLERQKRFAAEAWAVETNQFQELLAVQLGAAARARGMPLPIVQVVNTVNKQVRIRRLGPYLARGEIRFRATPGTRLLVDQLREFPEGMHDDGPDALEMALRVMIDQWNGRRQKPQPRRYTT